MPTFNVALQTRPGSGLTHDTWTSDGPLSPITQPTRLALAYNCPSPFVSRSGPSSPEASLTVYLNPTDLTLTCAATPETPHYFRLADATVKPLPPNPEPFSLTAGDAYIALTPGARQLADSPTIARFIHLRDYFNAEKLASALLTHLSELAPRETLDEDLTVLVIEAR
jgi:hypothetical protein